MSDVPTPAAATDETEMVRGRLATWMMLGRIFNERIEISRATKAIPADPDEWESSSVISAVWGGEFGEDMAKHVPTLIANHGFRPAEAVASLIQFAVRYGVEVGCQLERNRREPSS